MALVCPHDQTALQPAEAHHVPHMHCSKCGGGWFDLHEFEELEASVTEDQQALAGTLEYGTRTDELKCPSCGQPMTAFDFRGHDLALDACNQEHGFWLDAGEVESVRSIMQQRVQDVQRSARAEATWNQERERGFSRDLVEKLRNFFRGG